MGDLAEFKIKLADLISPQLKKITNAFGMSKNAAQDFEKETNKGVTKTKNNLSQLNMIGRLGNARNGLAAFSSGTKLAAMGINPIIAGLGLAAVGALKLGGALLESSQLLQNNLQITNQLLGGNVTETKALTAQATALTKVYGGEYVDTVQTASKLSKQFGISTEQALTLIQKGFASGANVGGNMLQLLSDSANSFKKLGATADQQIAIIQQSVSAGVEDAPKLLESFNKNLPNLGGDVKRLLDQNFGKGFTNTLKKHLETGEATAINALTAISTAVGKTNLSAGTSESLASQLFGDDSGNAVALLSNFSKFDTSLNSLVSKNAEFNSSKAQQLALEERLAATQLQSSKGFTNLANKATIFGLKVKIALFEGLNFWGQWLGEIWRVGTAVGGFIARIASINPLFIALKTSFSVLGNAVITTFSTVYNIARGLFTFIGNAFEHINILIDNVLGSSFVQRVAAGFNSLKDIVGGVLNFLLTPIRRISDALAGIVSTLKGLRDFDFSQIKMGLSEIKSGLTGTTDRDRSKTQLINSKKVGQEIASEIKIQDKPSELFKASTTDALMKQETQSKLSSGMDSIVAGGKEVRNVTVTIQKMVAIETLNSTVAESVDNAQKTATDLLVRILQGAETSLNMG
jgi:hypothetical protein